MCLVVAPHPDDETIGAGIWIYRNRSRRPVVLHVTDGSPRDMDDARAAGFASRQLYASARKREAHQALELVGIKRSQFRRFDLVDKETYLHLPRLISRMISTIERLRPSVVLSPAYEGGHPDHDAAALAVAIARNRFVFQHREYRLYHAGADGSMITKEFLPNHAGLTEVIALSAAEREIKSRMLRCFRTQAKVLCNFDPVDEHFRDAPLYDFTRPPHDGKLLYEQWGWGISGEEWRRRAKEALQLADNFLKKP